MEGARKREGAWTHHEATVGDVRLHWVEVGDGPLVVLLHGFPDHWYAWRDQIPALAAAGFRVVAPDMRGYGRSGKPRGISAYRVEHLTADVAGLIRHLGADRASVVGHDWGGVVGWYLPMFHPEVVERLAIVNAPHPVAFGRELRTADQLRRSWYAFAFQLPFIPEAVLRANDFRRVERVLRNEPVRRDAFSDEDICRYKVELARPGALTAMVNYYRASFQRRPPSPRRITVPTLLAWGEQDPHLSTRLTEGLDSWVPNLRVERIPEASHWVMADVPERLNQLLIGFLRETR